MQSVVGSAPWRRWACTAAVGLLGVGACSGPQPLNVAIRAADESAYTEALDQHASSPRDAFLAWKASLTGKPVAELATADAALSTTSNPFNANRDPVAVSRGAVIYKAHCMRCHGEEVRGGGKDMLPEHPCKDFHAFGKRFAVTLHGGAPRAWFGKISEGFGPEVRYPGGSSRAMPAFGDQLAREQIWLVITYLQSLDVYAEPEK